MTSARIAGIAFALPSQELTNEELARKSSDWTPEKILAKTGIRTRRIAGPNECSSDLGLQAAQKLFAQGIVDKSEIDYLLFCSQSPDYALPTTACLLQERLGLSTDCGALDFNLGCSGYIYGLSLAKGLIESGQAQNVLLITAETYSKFLDENDFSTRAIFGDAAAATLIRSDSPCDSLGPFLFGTDGRGAKNLIVKGSAFRQIDGNSIPGNVCGKLFMSGPDIFSFTLQAVPAAVDGLLAKAGVSREKIDLFVFHQANRFMLQHLRDKLQIPSDKFLISMEDTGNTVSATIPIALRKAFDEGLIHSGMTLMLVGFGVGYSWGGCLVRNLQVQPQ